MLVKFEVTVQVNNEDWTRDYGTMDNAEVRTDVKAALASMVMEAGLPFTVVRCS